jgi:hypothetical protein
MRCRCGGNSPVKALGRVLESSREFYGWPQQQTASLHSAQNPERAPTTLEADLSHTRVIPDARVPPDVRGVAVLPPLTADSAAREAESSPEQGRRRRPDLSRRLRIPYIIDHPPPPEHSQRPSSSTPTTAFGGFDLHSVNVSGSTSPVCGPRKRYSQAPSMAPRIRHHHVTDLPQTSPAVCRR